MSAIRNLLQWAESELTPTSADAALDSLLLLAEATGISRTHLPLREGLSDKEEEIFRSWVVRRKSGEPIQYITGRAHFRHLTLDVGPGVLIPRPESELLVSAVLAHISEIVEPKVLDLGAGSGALALSIASEMESAKVTAVESNRDAFLWLVRNSRLTAVEIVENDVRDFDGARSFDAVIANPPYIPEGEALIDEIIGFEPHDALFGGEEGLATPTLFIEAAIRALKPGGFLAIEHHESQGEAIGNLLERSFTNVLLHYDFNERARWSSGVLT